MFSNFITHPGVISANDSPVVKHSHISDEIHIQAHIKTPTLFVKNFERFSQA